MFICLHVAKSLDITSFKNFINTFTYLTNTFAYPTNTFAYPTNTFAYPTNTNTLYCISIGCMVKYSWGD